METPSPTDKSLTICLLGPIPRLSLTLFKNVTYTFSVNDGWFVIHKTSHASNTTTPLMVLLAVVSLFEAMPGHEVVMSPQCFGTRTQTAFPRMPPLCVLTVNSRLRVPTG